MFSVPGTDEMCIRDSREGCYLYLKDVVEGKTEVLLGSEEKEALERALGYK